MIAQDMAIIYKYAKQVYLKELRQVEAISMIQPELIEWNFNKNSFIDFCAALRHMLNGTKHTRGISTGLREFYLEKSIKNLVFKIGYCTKCVYDAYPILRKPTSYKPID